MARNHITRIMAADSVAKGTEETEKKAQAETRSPDPKNAKAVIMSNTQGNVDGNGSGLKFTTASQPTQEDAKKQSEEAQKRQDKKDQKQGNTVKDTEEKQAEQGGEGEQEDKGSVAAHPKTSKHQGGKVAQEGDEQGQEESETEVTKPEDVGSPSLNEYLQPDDSKAPDAGDPNKAAEEKKKAVLDQEQQS